MPFSQGSGPETVDSGGSEVRYLPASLGGRRVSSAPALREAETSPITRSHTLAPQTLAARQSVTKGGFRTRIPGINPQLDVASASVTVDE